MNFYQKNFDENFLKYKDSPIAIYGVGKNAERVLENVKGYNIRCLVDENDVGKKLRGLPIISLDEALQLVDVIIIAATPISTRIVYDRIKNTLPKNMKIFDIRGHNLSSAKPDAPYLSKTYEQLCHEIDRHEIVSFDIFDTLLMRRVYAPKDVFFIIEREIKEKGRNIPFAEWRIESEKRLINQSIEPNLNDIYDFMQKKFEISSEDIIELKSKEIEWEKRILTPRWEVVNAFYYALKKGKDVYLISDMYLPSDIIDELLKKKGIDGYKGIFVSNEWGTTKEEGGLYKVFLSNVDVTKTRLHIGDNLCSDIEVARRLGFSSFWVMNARDMLEISSIAKIKRLMVSLDDRIFVGEILNTIFNSPFALNIGKGKICFDNLSSIACTSFVGIAMGFISWILESVKGKSNAVLLFSSRDCYYLYKLYIEIIEKNSLSNLPVADYLYVSRQALRGVEITSYDKIMPYFKYARYAYGKTKFKDFLRLIFGTEFNLSYDGAMGDLSDEDFNEVIKNEIAVYSEEIISKSKEKRENYLRYLKRMNISRYDEIYLVDVQTTGSSLSSLTRLLDRKINLLTIRLIYNMDNISLLDKCAFVKEVSPISAFANKCMILEKVYASTGGQLTDFDKDGCPLFCDDTKYNEDMLEELQTSMKKFIDLYVDQSWYKRKLSVNLVTTLLDSIDSSCSVMKEDIIIKFASHDYLASNVNMNEMEIIRGINS